MSDGSEKITVPVILTPGGSFIKVSEELFEAINDFSMHKWTGSIELQMRDGGIAGVEANHKKRYVRQKGNSR